MRSFESMALAEPIMKSLQQLEFTTATAIQSKVIPIALEGKDLISTAETGSGKTAAYAIPVVTKLLENPQAHALILAPTRELAQQVSEFFRILCASCPDIRVTSIVGGADIRKQLKQLKKMPRIVVATPGRLTDHLKRRSLSLESTKILVLDEGDRMLDMGFAPQIDQILRYMPQERQTMLFTATLPAKVKELVQNYLTDPIYAQVGEVSQPVKTVRQSVIQLRTKEKDERLMDELNKRQGLVIVFAKTKRRTSQLADYLSEYGFKVDAIHGGRSQGQRNRAIQNFKSGEVRILCATDVAARGIDVPMVEHVINFDLPMMREDYIHRIGRTARNGASGEAVSFVTPEQHREWVAIARTYRIPGVELTGMAAEPRSSGRSFGGGRDGRGSRGSGRGSDRRSASGRGQSRHASEGGERRSDRFSDERNSEEQTFGKKTYGKKPFGKKTFGGKKPFGAKPFAGKSSGKPSARPSGKPSGKPAWANKSSGKQRFADRAPSR